MSARRDLTRPANAWTQPRRWIGIARTAGAATTAVGFFSLLGWLFDIAALKGAAFGGGLSVKTNTALALLLGGAALGLLAAPIRRRWVTGIGRGCAVLCLVIGALTVTEYVAQVDLGIDERLMREPPGWTATSHPNRTGPPAALCFALVGVALLLCDVQARGGVVLSQYLALISATVALVPAIGFLYGVQPLYGLAGYTNTALPTALTLLVWSLGVFLARPQAGLMRMLSADHAGAGFLRRIALTALPLVVVLAWVFRAGAHAGWYHFPLGNALFAVAVIVLLSALLAANAMQVGRQDEARRRAHASLEESDLAHRQMLASIPGLVWTSRADGYCDYVSPQWIEYTGVRREHQLGDGWADQLHPDDRDRALHAWRAAVNDHAEYDLEYRIRRHDGAHRWFKARGRPIRDATGTITRWFGTCVDVDDLKHAEEQAREANERHQLTLESAELGTWDFRVAAGELICDYRARALIGVTSSEHIDPQAALARVHPDDQVRVRETVRQAMNLATGDGRIELEFRVVRADGTPAWLLARGQAYFESSGTPRRADRLVGTVAGITARKQVEHELQRRRRSLRLLADTATRLLLTEEPSELINELFHELADHLDLEVFLHYVVQDDGSLRLSACAGISEQERAELEHVDTRQNVCGAAVREGRCIVLEQGRPCGDPRSAWICALGVRAYACHPLVARGRVIGTLSFGSRQRDCFSEPELQLMRTVCEQVAMAVERQRLVRELELRAAELAKANRAKDNFLAVLSHELRTPLTPVLATAAMLQRDSRLSEDVRESIDVIRRNAELEARLIDDLLDLTRIVRGKVELDRRPVGVDTILRRAVEVCRPEADARRLHLDLDLSCEPLIVDADAARLQQVFWNVLKNAVKFSPPGGSIAIRCRPDAGDAVVEIRDDGIGIEPDALGRIFNAFEQAERRVTRQFGGLGLGLAISKTLVELHGGTISAASAGPGSGATFTIRLPRCPVPGVTPAPHRAALVPDNGNPRSGHGVRILLVEDHGDTARILQRLLRSAGYEVETAGNVATALALAVPGRFDLLVSDLGLPDGSGLDLMRGLRAHGCALPGIALTGYGQEEDLERTRAAGFRAHLTKPVDLEQLEGAIDSVLAPRT